MTTSPTDLDRLAERVGIEPFFHDIWGNRTEVSPEAKRALITALGHAAGLDRAERVMTGGTLHERPLSSPNA